MGYIGRDIEKTIIRASESFAAILLTGPRQVGKTTTLRKLAGDQRGYVTLDDLEARRMARNDPPLFLSLHPAPVLIDEIQYAPELFSYIKMEIDNGAGPGSFWLSGSQAFRLMSLAHESLAGRAAILQMASLSQHEIYGSGECRPFTLSMASLAERARTGSRTDTLGQFERIWKGSMPALVSKQHAMPELFYSSYVQTYLERDIADLISMSDPLLFSDFIRVAAARTGQMVNVHDMALDLSVSDETVRRWLGILEKTSVVFFLRPYSNNLLKRIVKKPKLFFFDTGLVAYLTKHLTPEILMNGSINGAILENYVVAEIMKSYTNNGLEFLAHYYRDKDKREIDMVIEGSDALYPVEIKKTASPSPQLARNFKIIDGLRLPRREGAIICTGKELSAIDGLTAIVPAWTI